MNTVCMNISSNDLEAGESDTHPVVASIETRIVEVLRSKHYAYETEKV